LAESREIPARSFLSIKRGDGRPSELGKWFRANWAALAMLFFIFTLALFMRSYFGYEMASHNGYIVSGGSDSYYWQRIIDYSADTGKQLYWDPLINYPDGIRNPRPPLFSMSVVVPAVIAQDAFASLHDSLGWTFMWSTAFWGALTVVPTFFVGKEVFGRRAGLVAAFLLAIMPSHVQRSVLSNADHDSFILFFIVLTFYFLLKAVSVQDHRKWVENWRSLKSIRGGLKDYFRNSKTAVLYAFMGGTSFGAVIMAWVGFGYAAVLILAYYVIQVFLNKFKNTDSLSVTLIVMIAMGFGYLISFPVYYEQTLIPVRFDVPVYLFLASMFFGMMFVISRDFPWTLTLPAIVSILIVAVLAINVVDPSLGQAILSGQGYFVKNKLYSTIAEAKAPMFSEVAMGFGMVTFFMSLIGLIWAITRLPKHATAPYIFIVVWLGAAIFMAISAARFMFNAAPAFAIASAWVLVVIIDKLDFNSVRKSLVGASGSYLHVFRKSVKIRHVVGALFLAFMVVLPNVWYGTDAGIPSERKAALDNEIYSSLPDFMRPGSYDQANGTVWYFGAFGYSLPLPKYYFPTAWAWFSDRDSDTLPESQRPAYVSWWDYGFEAVQAGKHPTVADNFQNGYQLTGNIIMSQSEAEAIALFAYRLLSAGIAHDPLVKDQLYALMDKYDIDKDRMNQILSGSGRQLAAEILADPLVYGPMSEDISDANARIVTARVELTKLSLDALVSFYGDVCDVTDWDIRYFSVDSRMFPRSGQDTGIFYAPAKLSDRRITRGSTPTDFFEIKAVDIYGASYAVENVTSDMQIVDYKLEYKDMFYKSMFYRAMVGYSGTDVGKTNDGIPGLSGSVSDYPPEPGWNLTHFRVVYRTAYYNPLTIDNPDFRGGWRAISFEEAAILKEKIQAGDAQGYIDDSASNYYSAGAVFLEYYKGAYLNGTLKTEQGYPVADISVTIQDEYGIPHMVAKTDENGHYSLLAPFGNLTLTFSDGSTNNIGLKGVNTIATLYLNVTDDQAMRKSQDLDNDGVMDYIITKDFVMKGTSISGDVFWDLNSDGNYTADKDELIPAVTVYMTELKTNTSFVVNASDGSFDETMPPGQYDIFADFLRLNLTMGHLVNVTPGQKSVQKLAMKVSELVGTLLRTDGLPAEGAALVIVDTYTGLRKETTTDNNGNFTFSRITGGNYILNYRDGGEVVYNNRFAISPGATLQRTFTLVTESTMTYRIVSGGLPASHAVYMVSNNYDQSTIVSGLSDAYGLVEVTIPRGVWTLYATSFDGTNKYAGATVIDTTMTGSASGTLTLDLGASSVAGTLRSPQLLPLSDTYLVFESVDGARIPVVTADGGFFNIVLPSGTYKVASESVSEQGILSDTVVVQWPSTSFQFTMSSGVLVTATVWLDKDSSGGLMSSERGILSEVRVTDSAGRTQTTMTSSNATFSMVFPEGSPATVSLGASGYSQWSQSMTLSGSNASFDLVATPDLLSVSGLVTYADIGVRGIEVSFVPDNVLMSIVKATTGANGYYSALVPPSSYRVVVDQGSTPMGGEKYMFDQSATFLPSGSGAAYDIEPVKKVEMYGNLLGASTSIQLRLSGPEQKNLTLSSINYNTYVLPGTYFVYASGKTGSNSFVNTSFVELSLTSRNFDFNLQRAHALSGVISVDSSSVSRPVTVLVTASGGEVITAQSDMAGRYTLQLPPGSYSVLYLLEDVMTEGSKYVYIQYSSLQAVTMGSVDLGVSPSLTLELDNTTFNGTVVGPDDAPAQAYVELIANSRYGESVSFMTDALGVFDEKVQPGDYTIHVTRLQDKRSYLSTVTLTRNIPREQTIELADGRYLTGTALIGDQGAPLDLSLSSGSAKLNLASADDGSFMVLVPGGANYTIASSTTRAEHGMNVPYSGSSRFYVGNTDIFVEFEMNRDTKRGVSVSWDRALTQSAAPGVKVTYAVTVVNTGNIEDTFLATFTGTGFDVSFSPSQFTLDFGTNNKQTMMVDATAGNTLPAADTMVICLVRSKTLSSTKVDLTLYVDIAQVHGVQVTNLNESAPVSSASTITKFRVNNTGNAPDVIAVSIANKDALVSLGWTAQILDPNTGLAVTTFNLSAFGSKELNVSFTSIRADADPSAQAYVLASSTLNAGVSSYGSVPVMVPDLSMGLGDLQVSRKDILYQLDLSNLYVNTGLVVALGVLMVSFFVLRKKKGLGGGAKK